MRQRRHRTMLGRLRLGVDARQAVLNRRSAASCRAEAFRVGRSLGSPFSLAGNAAWAHEGIGGGAVRPRAQAAQLQLFELDTEDHHQSTCAW